MDEAIWGSGGKLYITYDAWIFDPITGQNVKTVVAPELYQVDPTTGLAIAIGHTNLGIGGATDVNGTTYAFNDVTNQVVSLDLTNGNTSFVTDFDPAAGVIQGAAPVPEPASVALAGIGLFIVVVGVLRRGC
ncbi:MAG: PEP-CTERM sorting domain-containing protein [Acidobacteriaceae bacterium]|nr:PEP-CTERM sorting domain-containing protein [Acidobacteriaceae bacterium]